MKRLLSITLLFFAFLLCLYAKRYEYLSYDQIIQKMKDLSHKYPNYCKLHNVKKEFNYTLNADCGNSSCKYWYLTISDFSAPVEHTNTLPQVLFTGGINGVEAIGPNIVINLADHLLEKNKEDQYITNLIKSRMIILLPLPNPSAYYYKDRKSSGVAAMINYIFGSHLIQAAVTFQEGNQSIIYSCGTDNYTPTNKSKAEGCPDEKALLDIARMMAKEADSNHYLFIKPFTQKRVPQTNFTTEKIKQQNQSTTWKNPFSPNLISDSNVTLQSSKKHDDSQSSRPLIFHVETSGFKQPFDAYLGSSEGFDKYKDWYAYGYIPMNIKLSLALLDVIEPYVKIKSLDYSKEKKTLMIKWQGGGCKNVDETYLAWTNNEKDSVFSQSTKAKHGPGYLENKHFFYEETISLNDTKFNIDFTIKLTCDQDWKLEKESNSSIGSQSYVVKSRTDEDYSVEANGYEIIGKKVVELNVNNITDEYFERKSLTNVKDLALNIEIFNCSNLERVGSLTAKAVRSKNQTDLLFTGELNVTDSDLEGYLHHYGDVSYCNNSAGDAMNITIIKHDKRHGSSHLLTIQNNETMKIDSQLNITKEKDIFGMIGRSIILKDNDNPDQLYIGQITLKQPKSCEKIHEMKDCLGISLGSHDGVCIVRVPLEDKVQSLKLFLQPGVDGLTINMNGIIPNKVIDYYDKFDEVYIAHENFEKKFSIHQGKLSNYSLIRRDSVNLSPDIALGTLLGVYIKVHGEKVLLGDCSVGLRDANLNETEYIMTHSSTPLHKETSIDGNESFPIGFVILSVVIIGVIIGFLVKRYGKGKQNLERGVSAGEEGRDIEIATETGPNTETEGIQDKGEKKQWITPKKLGNIESGDYIVFPDEVEDGGVL